MNNQTEKKNVGPALWELWATFCFALALFGGMWMITSTYSGRKAAHYEGAPPVQGLSLVKAPGGVPGSVQAPARDFGPAPKLRRGKTKVVRGKRMSSWIVSGAGDGSYNGTYSQVGTETFNGQPVYRLAGSPTGKALWYGYAGGDYYSLSPSPGGGPGSIVYASAVAVLPANPWVVVHEDGSFPAPTLTEYVPVPLTLVSSYGASQFCPTITWTSSPGSTLVSSNFGAASPNGSVTLCPVDLWTMWTITTRDSDGNLHTITILTFSGDADDARSWWVRSPGTGIWTNQYGCVVPIGDHVGSQTF